MALSANKVCKELAFLGAESLRRRASPIGLARRYWQLYRHRLFSPHEIRFFSLLDPALTDDALSRIVSKEALVRVQNRLNPPSARRLTEDKTLFLSHCLASGLPVPAILATYAPRNADIDASSCRLTNSTDLAAFLDRTMQTPLIVKPVNGVNGEGIMRLDRTASGWADTHGQPISAAQLATLIEASAYRHWLFQVFVEGHPDLRALSRTQALQTIRAVTAIDDAGKVHLLATRLRLGAWAVETR